MGFKLRRPPAKQQGPGSQRQPRPSLAYGDQRARGKKASVALLAKAHWGCGLFPEESRTFPNAAPCMEFGAEREIMSRGRTL